MLSLVVWNLQFREPESPAGHALRAAIAACEPDLVCLTEAEPGCCDLAHVVSAEADYGYPQTGQRRKVLIGSREPWTGVDRLGDPSLPPGRYVAATTQTALGAIAVHGVCIPWAQAHVATGRRDRGMWEDHMAYLAGLGPILARADPAASRLVLGDFNQAMPRRRAPKRVFDALCAALPADMRVVTAGPLPPLGLPAIDHVVCSGDLEIVSLRALSNIAMDGRRLSDHFGLHLRLRRRQALAMAEPAT